MQYTNWASLASCQSSPSPKKSDVSCVLSRDRDTTTTTTTISGTQAPNTDRWRMASSSMNRITGNNGQSSSSSSSGSVEPLQKGCVAYAWMPNWSHTSAFSAPSGVAIGLKGGSERTVISSHLFSDSSKYAYGTLAVPLPRNAKTAREGTPLVKFLRELQWATKPVTSEDSPYGMSFSSGALLHCLNDCVSSELLEHSGSFVGLYSSPDRRHGFSERLWVVVQAGDAAASEKCYDLVKEEGDGGSHALNTTDASWRKNFEHSSSPFRKAKEASKARRTTLARAVLDGVLNFDHEDRDISAYNPITTITNVFSGGEHISDMCVYYAGCSPVKQAGEKGQIVLNESPHTGIFVLEGVKPVAQYLGAFPYGTGRISSLAPYAVRQRQQQKEALLPSSDVFVWESNDSSLGHPRLHYPASDLFRMRTQEFREMEIKLGRNPAAKVVHLRPVAVKLADPKRRKGDAKKAVN